jgi:DNA-binding PadR family transcriptional regulator
LENDWIERVGEEPEPDETGHPRKVYRLTERGEQIIGMEKKRLRALLSLVQTRTVGEEK